MQEEHDQCTVCDQPMLPGQAFNGLKKAHWNCAPATRPTLGNLLEILVAGSHLDDAPEIDDEPEHAQADTPPKRLPEKGPTFAQARFADQNPDSRQVENRQWVEVWRKPVNGKSSIGLKCPFCHEVMQAFVWSLPNGKRCTCGAIHGRLGSTHWREPQETHKK